MKNLYKILPFLLLTILIPQITFASWWNPFSWFKPAKPVIQTTIKSENNREEIEVLKKEITELKKQKSTQSKVVKKPAPKTETITPISTDSVTQPEPKNISKIEVQKEDLVYATMQAELKPLYDQVNAKLDQVDSCKARINDEYDRPAPMQSILGRVAKIQRECNQLLTDSQLIVNRIETIFGRYGIYVAPARPNYPVTLNGITQINFDGNRGTITQPNGQIQSVSCDNSTCYIY